MIATRHYTADEADEIMRGYFDFKMTDYQQRYALDAINCKDIVACFSRQSGKSYTTGPIAIIRARQIPNGNILIFAPTDRQTGELADKIRNAIAKMPYLTDFHVERQTQRTFEFSNGARVRCFTVGDDGEKIRSLTGDVIILEEAGSIKDSIVQNVILPMGATTNAQIIKIGTPRGMNHFYRSYEDPKYTLHLVTCHQAVKAGVMSQDYVDRTKTEVDDLTFKTEMMAEFIADSDAYFGYDLIKSCIRNIDMRAERPEKGKTYYLGADIARAGQDCTLLTIVEDGDIVKVKQIFEIDNNTIDEAEDHILMLHNIWKFKKIYVDMTGLGAGAFDHLARKLNKQFKRQKVVRPAYDKTFTEFDTVVGVTFTSKSKLDIMSNLKSLMANGEIIYPDDTKLISQLMDFRYELDDYGNVTKLHHSEGGFDDYCFVAGTMVLTDKGNKPIETLQHGDLVMTRDGLKPIISTGSRFEPVITNIGLTGTADHPIITNNGTKRLKKVNASTILYTWNEKQSNIMEGSITDIRNHLDYTLGNTFGRTGVTNPLNHYTEIFGKMFMVKYRRVASFITRMKTHLTILLKTLNVCQERNINQYTTKAKNVKKSPDRILRKQWKLQRFGMVVKKGWSGIPNITKTVWQKLNKLNTHVFVVGRRIKVQGLQRPNIVPVRVNKNNIELITWLKTHAVSVKNNIKNINILKANRVRQNVQKVYNLRVKDCNEYFANNILVHNCDSLALAVRPCKKQKGIVFK